MMSARRQSLESTLIRTIKLWARAWRGEGRQARTARREMRRNQNTLKSLGVCCAASPAPKANAFRSLPLARAQLAVAIDRPLRPEARRLLEQLLVTKERRLPHPPVEIVVQRRAVVWMAATADDRPSATGGRQARRLGEALHPRDRPRLILRRLRRHTATGRAPGLRYQQKNHVGLVDDFAQHVSGRLAPPCRDYGFAAIARQASKFHDPLSPSLRRFSPLPCCSSTFRRDDTRCESSSVARTFSLTTPAQYSSNR